jgi:hypothetical protein
MNRKECEKIIDSYVTWLRKGLSIENLEDVYELTTPFLDRHNDHLQIYAMKRDGKIVLSDEGYILSDLHSSGLELTTPKRKAMVDTILNGLGVRVENDQLVVDASEHNIGQRLHVLIQAMLAINDMFIMAQPRVAGFFWEDVRAFLEKHNVRYSERVKIAGRSGYDHAIDFLIPKSRTHPERFVQAINAPNKNTIGAYLFGVTDTRESRGEASEAYAFLNDRERKVGGDVIEALEAYRVTATLWSQREKYVHALAE